jgi:L-ascorbate metabolism protein UlaG (beta-lactamase superfamily)
MFRLLRIVGVLAAMLVAAVFAYLQHPKFGAQPEGERLAAVVRSPHRAEGGFRNLVDTPMRTGESSLWANLLSMATDRNPNLRPGGAVPSIKTDLAGLPIEQDLVVWLGHSSYFVQIGGKRVLIDPVFSKDAAPVPYVNAAFHGATPYTAADMPAIDYLLITHDHWDHLDHPTAEALLPKVRHAVVGLGLGATLERWGYAANQVHEADWNDVLSLGDDVRIHVLPARHFSGRWLTRNQTLWVAFALETSERKLFFGGDSGYGPHFRDIGERFGGFDFVALDSGQYDRRWANIHMFPEEAAQAAEDLGAKALLPGHVGRFSIAAHDWDEPFKRMAAASSGRNYRLLTPVIGDVLWLDNGTQSFARWWEGVSTTATLPLNGLNATAGSLP